MKQNKQMLTSILKTTQMGQVGIRSALATTMEPTLRKALESQLREYDTIETEAHAIATRRGWELPELEPALGMMARASARMKLRGRGTDSKIASLMIQGNTKGMIQGLRSLHQMQEKDEQVRILNQKLLDCERANIRQMQPYL